MSAPTSHASFPSASRPGRSFVRAVTAVASTGGLLVGFGAVSAGSAFAASAADCTGVNTVSAGADQAANTLALQTLLSGTATVVCLDGEFVLTSTLTVNRDVTLFGRTGAVLNGNDEVPILLVANLGDPEQQDITLENLTLKNGRSSDGVGGGAIQGYGSITVSNSTFVDNYSAGDGGAIYGYGSVTVLGSTFVDNSANRYGGAVWADTMTVRNSTFVENTAGLEGGAIFTGGSQIEFSTFLNNTVTGYGPGSADVTPSNGNGYGNDDAPELPGESIYLAVSDGDVLTIRGNIFAGDGASAQLGIGDRPPEPNPGRVSDRGGNIFSTTALIEMNFAEPGPSTQFSKTPTQIFGAAATLGNNGGVTQTLPLIAGSPAIDAVPALLEPAAEQSLGAAAIGDVTLDQRGVARAGLLDAGSFEFVVPAATPAPAELPPTGADSGVAGWLAAIAALLLGGGLAVAVGARRRQSRSQR